MSQGSPKMAHATRLNRQLQLCSSQSTPSTALYQRASVLTGCSVLHVISATLSSAFPNH